MALLFANLVHTEFHCTWMGGYKISCTEQDFNDYVSKIQEWIKDEIVDYTLITPTSLTRLSLRSNSITTGFGRKRLRSASARNKQADINQADNFKDSIGVLYRCIKIPSPQYHVYQFRYFSNESPVYNSNITTQDADLNSPGSMTFKHWLGLQRHHFFLSSEAFWLKNTALAGNICDWLVSLCYTTVRYEAKALLDSNEHLVKMMKFMIGILSSIHLFRNHLLQTNCRYSASTNCC